MAKQADSKLDCKNQTLEFTDYVQDILNIYITILGVFSDIYQIYQTINYLFTSPFNFFQLFTNFTILMNQMSNIIITLQDMLIDQSAEEIALKYTKFALKHVEYREIKEVTLPQFCQKIVAMCLTSLVAHQMMYLLTPTSNQNKFTRRKIFSLEAIRRPTQHTITVFSLKILMDFFNQRSLIPYDEYRIGGAVGLLSYVFGRPMDQIEAAKRQIMANQGKHISRLEAISVVMRHDGLRGFYRHQNLLGPICSTMYRSVYFGLWARLLNQYGNKDAVVDFIAIPLLASLGASLSTAIPDKLRSFCLSLNDAMSKTLQRRNKNIKIEIPSTVKLMFEHLISPDFKFRKADVSTISLAVTRNWIILGCFAFSQDSLQRFNDSKNRLKNA